MRAKPNLKTFNSLWDIQVLGNHVNFMNFMKYQKIREKFLKFHSNFRTKQCQMAIISFIPPWYHSKRLQNKNSNIFNKNLP